MADAELVETGMAGPTVTDDRAEPGSAPDTPPPAFERLLTGEEEVPDAAADSGEAEVHLQGKPAWAFPPLQQTIPVPSVGPPGRRRHPFTVLLASALTLGVSSIVWHARVNREISEFDARVEVAPRRSALAVALAWLAGLACSMAGAALLVGHQLHLGPTLAPAVSGFTVAGHTVLWDWLMLGGIVVIPYVILLVPISAIAVVMTLERLRIAEERAGLPAEHRVRPVRQASLLLLPIFGGLVHVAVFQSRLNQIWQRAFPAGAPGPS
jgi:hypothetical protein